MKWDRMEITMSEKTKKTRRRYSDEFRASALAALEANGGNVARTAKALDIPVKTLELWSKGQNPVSAELCQQKKRDVMDGIESLLWKFIGVEFDFKEMNLKDFGIAFGITVDKYLAMKGMPNVIQQNINTRPNIIDPSKMTPAQRKALAVFLDELNRDQAVQYDPQPGDPDYKTGLDGESP